MVNWEEQLKDRAVSPRRPRGPFNPSRQSIFFIPGQLQNILLLLCDVVAAAYLCSANTTLGYAEDADSVEAAAGRVVDSGASGFVHFPVADQIGFITLEAFLSVSINGCLSAFLFPDADISDLSLERGSGELGSADAPFTSAVESRGGTVEGI